MLSDRAKDALRDIGHYATTALGYVNGITFEQFKADERTFLAASRCLEIISEASRRLPAEFKARHPHIAWNRMAAAGNIYRHEYDVVETELVWETVQKALPPLRAIIDIELGDDEWK